jgi:hypothetical protein
MPRESSVARYPTLQPPGQRDGQEVQEVPRNQAGQADHCCADAILFRYKLQPTTPQPLLRLSSNPSSTGAATFAVQASWKPWHNRWHGPLRVSTIGVGNSPGIQLTVASLLGDSSPTKGDSKMGKQYAVDRGSSGMWRFVGREPVGHNFRVARDPAMGSGRCIYVMAN